MSNVQRAPSPRELRHLHDMCDGQRYAFFDHELAYEMRQAGWIRIEGGNWRITEAGRAVVASTSHPTAAG